MLRDAHKSSNKMIIIFVKLTKFGFLIQIVIYLCDGKCHEIVYSQVITCARTLM
jgi:hypothetical protein